MNDMKEKAMGAVKAFLERKGYVDWQPFLGHFSQRLRPAFRNSTGLMYPSVECIRSLLYHHT